MPSKDIIPRIASAQEIGVTGLHQFDGVIHEEILRTLRWPEGNKVWREMSDNDPVIGSILFAVEMLIRGVEWNVEPADESALAKERAEFVESMMDDMEKPWSEVINDITSFLPFGFSVHEPVYKRRMGMGTKNKKFKSKHSDGYWAWRKIPVRAQDSMYRWIFSDDNRGELLGVEQQPINGEFIDRKIIIPRDRFLLFRVNSKKDNPESRSILRNAYRPWFFKKKIEEFEAIGIERDLAGIPVVEIPPQYMSANADPAQKALYNAMQELVTSLRNNEQAGVVFPRAFDEGGNKLFEIKLLGRDNGSGKAFDTEQIIQRYDKRIAGTILADFILLGQQSVGSFALSDNKTNMFAAAIGAWLESISSVFNSEALVHIWELNGWDVSTLPKLTYGDIEKKNLELIAKYFGELSRTGTIIPDEELENWLRGLADAPLRDDESDLNQEKIQEITPDANTAGNSGSTTSGSGGSGSSVQKDVLGSSGVYKELRRALGADASD